MGATTVAILAVLALIVIAAAAAAMVRRGAENFYTQYAEEEPTRSYVAYTGTVPYGEWGTQAWAEAYPYPICRGCQGSLRDVELGLDVLPICATCRASRAAPARMAPARMAPARIRK